MPSIVEKVIRFWVDIGLLDVVLPFVLVFSIVYAVLERTRVLGEERGKPIHRYNALVAFVIGFLVVASLQLVGIIQRFAQFIALAVVGIVFLYIIGSLLGTREWHKLNMPIVVSFLAVGLAALYALGIWEWINLSWVESFVLPAVITLGTLLLLIWFIVHEKKPAAAPEKKPEKKPSAGPKSKLGPERILKAGEITEEPKPFT